MKGLGWRVGLIAAVVLLFAYLTFGNFVPKGDRLESSFWKDDGLRLGLDLQGGIHWVVGVELPIAINYELEFLRDGMRERLSEEGVSPENVRIEGAELHFTVRNPAEEASVRDVVDGRLDRVYEAEYNHYVWRVRPLCAYCNVVLTRSTLTRDHVVPRSAGGGPGDNLVPCCGPCNRAKANRTLLEFLARRVARRVARA